MLDLELVWPRWLDFRPSGFVTKLVWPRWFAAKMGATRHVANYYYHD